MSKYEENLKKVTKFCDKHPKNKNYSFDSDLSQEYRDGIRETESRNAIDNIFDYGFMQGYKQKEAELKKERTNMTWYKRRLLDLLKDAPDWADFMFIYLYSFICSAIIKGMFPMIPKRKKEIEQHHAEMKNNLNNPNGGAETC